MSVILDFLKYSLSIKWILNGFVSKKTRTGLVDKETKITVPRGSLYNEDSEIKG